MARILIFNDTLSTNLGQGYRLRNSKAAQLFQMHFPKVESSAYACLLVLCLSLFLRCNLNSGTIYMAKLIRLLVRDSDANLSILEKALIVNHEFITSSMSVEALALYPFGAIVQILKGLLPQAGELFSPNPGVPLFSSLSGVRSRAPALALYFLTQDQGIQGDHQNLILLPLICQICDTGPTASKSPTANEQGNCQDRYVSAVQKSSRSIRESCWLLCAVAGAFAIFSWHASSDGSPGSLSCLR